MSVYLSGVFNLVYLVYGVYLSILSIKSSQCSVV